MPTETRTVSFNRWKDSTKEDCDLLRSLRPCSRDFIADNALNLLTQLDDTPVGFKINRYQHSLQSATRALREGADDETVVCALPGHGSELDEFECDRELVNAGGAWTVKAI